MKNLVLFIVLAVILALAGLYVYRAKKKGKACIGCPYRGQCGSETNGGCNCSEEK